VLGNTCKPILLLTGIADQNLRCESRALLELLHRYAGPMHTLRVHLPLVHGARNGFAHLEPANEQPAKETSKSPPVV
jgi:hypothetical protein